MAHLIGRLVHVPRAVFAADIKRGLSQPPPNGIHWVAEVLQYDQGKLDSEGAGHLSAAAQEVDRVTG